ncbi:MAG: TonB family protein [Bacteroidetes bacterium]|nr:MAG: TonB family protein [Bacteroidota bacterium]
MKVLKCSILTVLTVLLLSVARGQDAPPAPYFLISEKVDKAAFPLLHTSAEVNIAGVVAEVLVTQVYYNGGAEPVEATYLFPGSTRAAIHALTMEVGDRRIKAQIRKKNEARTAYNQAKKAGKNAALLEQKRPNVFQMNVANIMPGDTIRVKLRYSELMVPEAGEYVFVYPTVVGPRYPGETPRPLWAANKWVQNPYLPAGKAPPGDWNIEICLNAGLPIEAIQCPSHETSISFTNPTTAEITLRPNARRAGNKDFILRYRLRGKAIESGVLSYEGEGESFFLAMVQPPERVEPVVMPAREYIFVLDVSGSMNGFPISVSKALFADLTGQLSARDRFNVMLFAGGSAFLSEQSLPVTPQNLDKAIQIINNKKGGGGTNMLAAIQKAMAHPKPEGFSRTFVLLTDGYVSVENQLFDYIRDHLGDANFFAFGIGKSVNRFLIEGIARVGMAESFVVTSEEEAPAVARRFRSYISSPVLTNIRARFEGIEVYDLVPENLPDLMADRPILLFGKYKGAPAGKIVLTGQTGKGSFRKVLDVGLSPPDGKNAALRQLWARHRLMTLSDYAEIRPGETLEDSITALGLQYNLLTKYTSFVAIDEIVRNKTGKFRSVAQPLPLPEGVPNSAISGIAEEEIEFIDQSIEEKTTIAVPRTSEPPAPPPPPPPVGEVCEIYKVVEEMPRFPGCEDHPDYSGRKACAKKALMEYIARNFRRTQGCDTVLGIIVVRFIVEKDGRITNVEVIRRLCPALDREAVRVVQAMPPWIPGKQRGKPVRVQFNLPVRVTE